MGLKTLGSGQLHWPDLNSSTSIRVQFQFFLLKCHVRPILLAKDLLAEENSSWQENFSAVQCFDQTHKTVKKIWSEKCSSLGFRFKKSFRRSSSFHPLPSKCWSGRGQPSPWSTSGPSPCWPTAGSWCAPARQRGGSWEPYCKIIILHRLLNHTTPVLSELPCKLHFVSSWRTKLECSLVVQTYSSSIPS